MLAARRGSGTWAKAAAKLRGETDDGVTTTVDSITDSFGMGERVEHVHPRKGARSLHPGYSRISPVTEPNRVAMPVGGTGLALTGLAIRNMAAIKAAAIAEVVEQRIVTSLSVA